MIRHRHIDLICGGAILLALVLTGLLCFGESLGLRPASAAPVHCSASASTLPIHRCWATSHRLVRMKYIWVVAVYSFLSRKAAR